MLEDNLNEKQLNATNATEGPLLILAGAGTGKTKTAIARIKNILLNGLAKEPEILALTFTNKAAKEMRHRLQGFENLSDMWIGTFHSVCSRMLRIYHSHAGLQHNFVIIDQTESESIIKTLLREMGKEESASENVKIIKNCISSFKEKGISPYDTNNATYKIKGNLDVVPIYKAYQERLQNYNLVDFDDLIFLTNQMLDSNKTIREELQKQFKYVFVDEYQDTSFAQCKFVQSLAGAHNNICCVGDEDQSIYSWRGADIKNILGFTRRYPNAQIIRLEQNYRSTGNIIKVAMAVISNNKNRYEKDLFTQDQNGEKVKIICSSDCKGEGLNIVKEIRNLAEKNIQLNRMAILVRSSFQNRILEEVFNENRMPYRIIDGIKFYDRKEVKDIIAYLRIAYSMLDGSAFERVINVPKRGVGAKTVSDIQNFSEKQGLPVIKTLRQMIEEDMFSTKIGMEIKTFCDNVEGWHNEINKGDLTLSELAKKIAHESGYIEMLNSDIDQNDDAKGRLENIHELISSLDGFHSLHEFLEHVALVNTRNLETSAEAVNILTIHGSKGLEFDVVFCPGWEETVFPSSKSLEIGNEQVEEERRLAYVAITRARQRLFLLYSTSRMTFGRWSNNPASRFLVEIKQHCNEESIMLSYNEKKSDNEIINNPQNRYKNNRHTAQRNEHNTKNATTQHTIRPSATNPFKTDDTVKHKTFGDGIVIKTIGQYVQVRIDGEEVIRMIHKDFLQKP